MSAWSDTPAFDHDGGERVAQLVRRDVSDARDVRRATQFQRAC